MTDLTYEQRRAMDAKWDAWDASGFGTRHRYLVGQEHGDNWSLVRDEVFNTIIGNGIAAILGPRGVGKTQMAGNVAHDLNFQYGKPCRYFRMSDFAAAARDQARGGGAREAAWLNSFAVKPLLVLDELHECLGNNYEDVLLRGTIDRRYMKKRPTILISNHTPAEFAKAVGESVMSRIEECGKVFVCKWKSYRIPTEANE